MTLARSLSIALSVLVACASAQASDFFCNNYVAGTPLQHYQCVQTTVGPGTPLIISLDQAGSGPLYAASVSAGSGPFGSSSSANASAEPGTLRGFASAEVFSTSIEGAQAVARSDAWFVDSGTIIGSATAPVGTPVVVRFIVDLVGGFAGGATFTALSEATIDFVTRGPDGAFIHANTQADRINPSRFATAEANALVGDTFEMVVKLHVAAGAINNGNASNLSSVADVSNTGRLFVDVLSGDASVIGAGGHLYASSAVTAVPEPSQAALLLAGLGVLGTVARRRSRSQRVS